MSVIPRVAVLVPVAVGLNVTLMVQFAPAATELPQLLVCEKSPALVPEIAMLEICSVAVPEFVRVSDLVLEVPTLVLAKFKLVADRLTAGAVPVPVKGRLWGLPGALSLTLTDAVRVPVAVGVKVTLIVQVPPVARVEGLMGQLVVCAKSPLFAPVTEMPVMVNAAVPLLVSVAV